MKFLIISDMFSLDSWLVDGKKPEIMPAVYEFYNYLGSHTEHSFDAVIAHPSIDKIIDFPNGSKIYIYKLKVPNHYLRKFFSISFLRNKAEALLLKNKNYHLVYGMTIYANVAKKVGQQHNLFSVGRLFGSLIWDTIQRGKWIRSRTRFYYQRKEIENPCDLTICTEDGTQFDLAINKYSPSSKVEMIYNGVNKDFRKKLLSLPVINRIDSKNEIRFCYIARLTQWKRQDMALDVINQLKKSGLKVTLDIYGKGETQKLIEQKVVALHLTNEVTFKGSVVHEEIPKILKDYQVSMFLYDASNLGNAMWESALSGRLIFTRDTGKTSEIFNEKNSILVEGENIGKAIETFIALLDTDITHPTYSRKKVDELLPNWEERFDNEIKIISDYLQKC